MSDCHKDIAGAEVAAPDSRSCGTRENATILVVDDEPGVRRLCRIILERAGYKVVEADSADSARMAWQARQGAVDLLLTDYNMTGDTGLELSEWLHAENASIPVILMSGANALNLNIPARISFLQKPFTVQALVETVRTQILHATCARPYN